MIATYGTNFFVNTNILTLIMIFSPNETCEEVVITIQFDLDPNFVVFHHIIRLLFILFAVSFILKLLNKLKN